MYQMFNNDSNSGGGLKMSEYLIPSEIELTDNEIAMLRSHGITVWEVDKMSKEELETAYNWAIENDQPFHISPLNPILLHMSPHAYIFQGFCQYPRKYAYVPPICQ
jgi:hypothetical protein